MPLSAKILFSQLYTGLPLLPVIPPLLTVFLLFFRLFLPLNGGHRFGYALRPIGPAQPVIVSGDFLQFCIFSLDLGQLLFQIRNLRIIFALQQLEFLADLQISAVNRAHHLDNLLQQRFGFFLPLGFC